jgi:hypothetical protein
MILYRCHQGEREDRGPQERVAERGAGNQSGAKIGEESAEAAFEDKRASGSFTLRRVLTQ